MTDSTAPATPYSPDGEDFVDLYAILGVSPTAPVADLRRRIGVLYTEAQENLDHRNFRKRFYYHELYEVHLPQAHNVLLDDARRAGYDTELVRQRGGKPLTATPGFRPASTVRAPASKPAGQRPPAHPAPQAPVIPSTPSQAPAWNRMDRETVERRRDSNRRELIKNELQAAGRRAGTGVGAAVFVGLGAALGLTAGAMGAGLYVKFLTSLPGIAAAYFTGRAASRNARRNIIATLSQMPYEELLMRYSH